MAIAQYWKTAKNHVRKPRRESCRNFIDPSKTPNNTDIKIWTDRESYRSMRYVLSKQVLHAQHSRINYAMHQYGKSIRCMLWYPTRTFMLSGNAVVDIGSIYSWYAVLPLSPISYHLARISLFNFNFHFCVYCVIAATFLSDLRFI